MALQTNQCCCEDGCCVNIITGDFNHAGDLVMETAVLTVVIEMPTKNSRMICGDDRVTLRGTLKSPYDDPGNSPFTWHAWLDRDWYHASHTATTERHEGAHWFIWETTDPTSELVLDWKECWVDYITQYGDIVFGVDVGEPSEEFIEIICEDVEPVPADCCVYEPECEPCHWIFQDMGDPTGPEEINEGRLTFWFEDPTTLWAIKVEASGFGSDQFNFTRSQSLIFEVGFRPPKDKYLAYDTDGDICFAVADWTQLNGSSTHPNPPAALPAFIPATSCSGSVVEDTGSCPDILRTETDTDALLFTFLATVYPCLHDCGDELDPGQLSFSGTFSETSPAGGAGATLTPYECPNPDEIDCCADCTFGGNVWIYEIQFESQPSCPPPDFGFDNSDGLVIQLGYWVEDCTTTSGWYLLSFAYLICEERDMNDNELATEIHDLMATWSGETVANWMDTTLTSYLTLIDCSAPYDGACDALVCCEVIDLEDIPDACCSE